MLTTCLNMALTLSALALFFDFFLILFLQKILNPIFDPEFKTALQNFTWLSWSTRLARAGQYATWVAQGKVNQAFVKSAEGQDFASQVTPKILRLCRLHLYCIWIFVFLGLPAGLILSFL